MPRIIKAINELDGNRINRHTSFGSLQSAKAVLQTNFSLRFHALSCRLQGLAAKATALHGCTQSLLFHKSLNIGAMMSVLEPPADDADLNGYASQQNNSLEHSKPEDARVVTLSSCNELKS